MVGVADDCSDLYISLISQSYAERESFSASVRQCASSFKNMNGSLSAYYLASLRIVCALLMENAKRSTSILVVENNCMPPGPRNR